MLKMSKKELNRKIRRAKVEAVKATLGIISLYSFGFAMIVYAFLK